MRKTKQFVMVRSYLVSWRYRKYDIAHDSYFDTYDRLIIVARSCVHARQLSLPLLPGSHWAVKVRLFSEVECKVETRM